MRGGQVVLFDEGTGRAGDGTWWSKSWEYRRRVLDYVESVRGTEAMNSVYGMRLEVIDMPVLFTQEAVRINGIIQHDPVQDTPNCIHVLLEEKMYVASSLPEWLGSSDDDR